jgi:outer membrane lipoprotein-sorting protein
MSVWTRYPALRWLVPGVTAVVVVGGGAAASAIAAQDEPDLPPRSAAELLVNLQTAQIGAVSGTVVTDAELGLPALPADREEGAPDMSALWSGSATLRVWYDGPERVRVALLGTLSQSDIIRNGRDLWMWDSGENAATHRVLPEGFADSPAPLHPGMTPQELAEHALDAIEPSTEVTSDDTTRVAGRDAYELVLAPRDEASLVRQIRIAIDAEQSLPLQVQVYGDEAEPAYEARFTQISFEAPDPEQFRFNPPPDATVTEEELVPEMPSGNHPGLTDMTVVGDGWSSVLVTSVPADLTTEGIGGFLALLPSVEGTWGSGHVFSSELFSVLLTDDGRLLIGAVTQERLTEAAADPAADLTD